MSEPEHRVQAAFVPYPTIVETTHRGERSWDIFSPAA
jgi:hypothetical protein